MKASTIAPERDGVTAPVETAEKQAASPAQEQELGSFRRWVNRRWPGQDSRRSSE